MTHTAVVALVCSVLLVVNIGLAYAAFHSERSSARAVIVRVRWWMLPTALVAHMVGMALYDVFGRVPGFDWSWLTDADGHLPTTAYRDSLWMLPVLVAIMGATAIAAPHTYYGLEQLLRRAPGVETRGWGWRIGLVVAQGLMIVPFGLPLAFGLAYGITVGGPCTWLYLRRYRDQARQRYEAVIALGEHPDAEPRDRQRSYQTRVFGRLLYDEHQEVAEQAACHSAAFATVWTWIMFGFWTLLVVSDLVG